MRALGYGPDRIGGDLHLTNGGNNVTSTDNDLTPNASGVSRRSVVRVGAAAAWTVPLVQVATAAPALAVSGPAKLDIQGFYVSRDEKKTALKVYISSVKNTGGQPAGQVTVVVRVPKTKKGSFSKRPWLKEGPSQGWSFAGRTGNGPWDFTFVSYAGVPAGGKTKHLLFLLGLTNNGKAEQVTITATAYASGATPDSESRTIR